MNAAPVPPPPPAKTIDLDVRGLAPPEPMQRVFEALSGLARDATLVVQIHREPVYLYQLIAPQGWCRSARQLAPDHWEIRFWRQGSGGSGA